MKTKTPDVLTEKCVKEVEEASVSLDIWTLRKEQHLEFIAKEHKIKTYALLAYSHLHCFMYSFYPIPTESNPFHTG